MPQNLSINPVDSTPQADTAKLATHETSLFKGHSLQNPGTPQVRDENGSWQLAIFLVSFIILAYLRTGYAKGMTETLRAAWDGSLAREIFREENLLTQRSSLLLLFNFFLVTPLIPFHFIANSGAVSSNAYGFLLYLQLFGLLLAIYLTKFIVLKLTGFIFNTQNSIDEYLFHTIVLLEVSGVFFLPIAILLTYSSLSPAILFAFAILIFLSAYTIRVFRGFRMNWRSAGLSRLYIIYYFCALELVPAIVLSKLLLIVAAH